MNPVGSFIPIRFLSLTAHFVILVTLLWSLESNLKACLPLQYTQDEYNVQNTNLTVGLSVAIAFYAFEMLSFLFGISMFITSVSLLSTFCHICASVTLSLYTLEGWKCTDYWYIFAFCSAIPMFFESVVVLMFLLGKKR